MRIDIDTSHIVKVVLSRRNVEALLHALDTGESHMTLTRSFGADTKGVIVGVEENDVHYPEGDGGLARLRAKLAGEEVYCPKHDLFDCWFCEAV